jgi:hypothetical protein
LGASADELDLPRMRCPQGRFRNGADLGQAAVTTSVMPPPEAVTN